MCQWKQCFARIILPGGIFSNTTQQVCTSLFLLLLLLYIKQGRTLEYSTSAAIRSICTAVNNSSNLGNHHHLNNITGIFLGTLYLIDQWSYHFTQLRVSPVNHTSTVHWTTAVFSYMLVVLFCRTGEPSVTYRGRYGAVVCYDCLEARPRSARPHLITLPPESPTAVLGTSLGPWSFPSGPFGTVKSNASPFFLFPYLSANWAPTQTICSGLRPSVLHNSHSVSLCTLFPRGGHISRYTPSNVYQTNIYWVPLYPR